STCRPIWPSRPVPGSPRRRASTTSTTVWRATPAQLADSVLKHCEGQPSLAAPPPASATNVGARLAGGPPSSAERIFQDVASLPLLAVLPRLWRVSAKRALLQNLKGSAHAHVGCSLPSPSSVEMYLRQTGSLLQKLKGSAH